MTKKRDGADNWFMLPQQERGALMRSHGELGKTYLDVLSEYTTGGVGLDRRGNGVLPSSVTTTSNSKKIVYDMRFEEASARYGHLQRLLRWYHHRRCTTRRNLWIIKGTA